MATQYQRRPDAATAERQAEALAKAQAEKAEADLAKEARRAQQKAEDGQDVSADAAATLQRGMGNSAVAAMLRKGSESDTSTSNAEATQEEAKDEEQDEAEDVDTELERVLPSFSTGGGGGGSGGTAAPWAMGRLFGGDDDGDDEIFELLQPRWRPMPGSPDPDDEPPPEKLESEGGDDGADPDEPWAEAEARFGEAPWEPELLSRGLRHARRLARRGFGPEALGGPEAVVWSRGRALLRWLAARAPRAAVRALARAAAHSGVPEELGYAGAIAAQLAMLESLFAALPPEAARIADVAVDLRSRPRAEQLAGQMLEQGGMSGSALLQELVGELPEAATGTWPETVDAAALAALERAGAVLPLPLVDVWKPAEIGPELDEVDLVLRAFTGAGEEEADAPLSRRDVRSFFAALNALVGAIGGVQVELAAAAAAAWPWAEHAVVVGVMRSMDAALRRAVRRVIHIGQGIEATFGTQERARLTELSREAALLRDGVEAARGQALAALAAALVPEPGPVEPEPLAELELALGRGAVDEVLATRARSMDEALLLAAAELRVAGAHAAADRFRALSASPGLAEPLRRAARLQALLGAWLGGEPERARRDAEVLGDGGPYQRSFLAMLRQATGEAAALDEAAARLREEGEGGALNLIKARWVELR